MIRSAASQQQGFLLITVVVVLAILAAMALMLSTSTSLDNALVAGHADGATLDYVAESGMEHARWQLAQNTSCSGYTSVPSTSFGGDSYSATITPNDASPVSISATGILANGAQKTLTRNNVRVFSNALASVTLQPGPEGEDTYIWDGAHKDTNFGATQYMELNNASAERVILMRFDLSSIPAEADISSATLELYLEGGNGASNGVVDAHRVTQTWFEGEEDDNPPSTPGATYLRYDGTTPAALWANSGGGGDFDPAPVATTIIPNLNQGWHQWDVSALAVGGSQSELAGNGVLLRASGGNVDKIKLTSGDGNASERPKLIVTYACECGQPCAAGASGNLLLVVGNATNLTTEDLAKKAMIESWSYAVVPISDEESQANIDAALATADVVYITESVSSGTVNTKLTGATIGVLNEEGDLNDELGMSSDNITYWTVDLSITENSHYITETFAIGTLPIVNSSQRMNALGATMAPGLQNLALSGSNSALDILDSGAALWGGGSAAGRRVKVPWAAAADFDVNALNTDGRTLLKRAIQWGAGAGGGGGAKKVLFVVGSVSGPGPTTEEIAHQTLIESWGHTVELIDDDASQVEFDTAVANNDIVFITNDITASNLNTKLVDANIGVVTSEDNLSDEFGLSSSIDWESGSLIEINDNTHYITSLFSLGLLTYSSASESLAYVTGTLSPDLDQLASSTSGYGVVTLEAGASMHGGGTVAGRRAQLPWGGNPILHPNDLSADGLTILKRALEWGAGAGPSAGNRLLFVVTDAASPVGDEIERQTLVESWGYIVTRISDEDSQAEFDAAVAVNDLAYISADALYNNVGIKLKAATIGVAFESYQLHNEFGMSAGGVALANLQSITILDNSHYITSPFTGVVNVVTTNTQLSSVSSYAVDTQLGLLASIPSYDGALATFDTGDLDHWGEIVAGRRVKLPWGSTDWGFDFSTLTADGENILKRSLEWIAGANGDSLGPIAHWKLDDAVGTTALDSEGGHDGTLNNGPAWVAGQLGGALNLDGSDDYIDLTSDVELDDVFVGGATVMAWIEPAGWGENGYGRIFDKSSSASSTGDGWVIRMNVDNGGIINFGQGFTGGRGWWAIPNGSISLNAWQHIAVTYDSSTAANDPSIYLDGSPTMVTEKDTPSGAVRSDNSINLRLGNFAGGTTHTFDGKIDDARIYDRVLDAAEIADIAAGGGGGGGGGSCDGTFRDEFNQESYANNDGTLPWSTEWLEINEKDGWDSGDERVEDKDSKYHLQVKDNDGGGEGVQRKADLSGRTSATFTYEYRRDSFDNSNDYVMVQISRDGGSSWVELERISGPGTDSSYSVRSHDISKAITSDTRVRFLTSPNLGGSDKLYVDNIEIVVSGCAD